MKALLISGWVLAAAAITTMTLNVMFAGEMIDCMKPKQSNPLSTPCDECHLTVYSNKYLKCQGEEPNPIETTCDESTTENGVVCEENSQGCTGAAIWYETAQNCANDVDGEYELQTCDEFGITWTEATWQDMGDDPDCQGGGVE